MNVVITVIVIVTTVIYYCFFLVFPCIVRTPLRIVGCRLEQPFALADTSI